MNVFTVEVGLFHTSYSNAGSVVCLACGSEGRSKTLVAGTEAHYTTKQSSLLPVTATTLQLPILSGVIKRMNEADSIPQL